MTQAAIKPVQVGDIFTYTWGYDQTNVEFYQVVRISEKSAWLVEIGTTSVKTTGWASDKVIPNPTDIRKPKPIVKRIQIATWSKEPYHYFSMDHGSLRPWDEKPEHRSWYA